jgi:UDP-N-acetylglucosamine acyltransferase
MSRIHETALVDPAARIADDVEIGAFSLVGPKVTIGPGSRIGPHVVVTGRPSVRSPRTRSTPARTPS